MEQKIQKMFLVFYITVYLNYFRNFPKDTTKILTVNVLAKSYNSSNITNRELS